MPVYDTATEDVVPIQKALARAMRDVGSVGKVDFNQQQQFAFRGIDGVLNAVGPALRDHGIVPMPTVLTREESLVATKSGGQSTRIVLEVRYAFTGPAGDYMAVQVPGEAMDSGDKAYSKAMSVAFRTALIQVLAIPTQERDPDHDIYERAGKPLMPEAAAHIDWDANREQLADNADGLVMLYRLASAHGVGQEVLDRIAESGRSARAAENGAERDE